MDMSARRFPVTLTALAASAIAVPLYLVAHSAAAVPADEVAVADAEAPAVSNPHAFTGTPNPTAAASTAKSGYRGDVEGRTEEAAMPVTASAPAPAGAGMAALHDGPAGDAVGDGMVELDGVRLRHHGRERPSSSFDESLQANVLTAGRTDDRIDRTSIDQLRTLATGRDQALAQAIPNNDIAGSVPAASQPPAALEIGFVLDTTGSMGDELSYLKVEMRSIAKAIATEFPGVTQRYALVAYRDHGDAYVVRHQDFTSLDRFVSRLGEFSAGGGGDHPEALDAAMTTATELQWSGPAAKMMFVVGDAPPHSQDFGRYAEATHALASANVAVYPVASSGVDTTCEYLMRWAARATGGQYIFLTDHSGIGSPHAAPHVEQYELRTLRDHMLDVIRQELGAVPTSQTQDDYICGTALGEPRSTWWAEHGAFMFVLGSVFVLGFAADMATAHGRRRA